MAPFCLGRVLDLGVLIVLSWLCDLQALEIQNPGFNYMMTSISLRLIHKALGLKGLGGREYHFGSRSPVLYGRTGCQIVWCVVGREFCTLCEHMVLNLLQDTSLTVAIPWRPFRWGFIGDLVLGFTLTGSFLRSQAFFKSSFTTLSSLNVLYNPSSIPKRITPQASHLSFGPRVFVTWPSLTLSHTKLQFPELTSGTPTCQLLLPGSSFPPVYSLGQLLVRTQQPFVWATILNVLIFVRFSINRWPWAPVTS